MGSQRVGHNFTFTQTVLTYSGKFIPFKQPLPIVPHPNPKPMEATFLLSISMSLTFRFYIWVVLCSPCPSLTYFTLHHIQGPSMLLQRTGFPSFSWLSNIPLYTHSTSLSVHLLMDVSWFPHRGYGEQCFSEHRSAGILFTSGFIPLDISPELELLDHMTLQRCIMTEVAWSMTWWKEKSSRSWSSVWI